MNSLSSSPILMIAGCISILADISLIRAMYSSVFCIIRRERICSFTLSPISILYILSGLLSVNSSPKRYRKSSSWSMTSPSSMRRSVNLSFLVATISLRDFQLMAPSTFTSSSTSSMISALDIGGILASLSRISVPCDSMKSLVSRDPRLNCMAIAWQRMWNVTTSCEYISSFVRYSNSACVKFLLFFFSIAHWMRFMHSCEYDLGISESSDIFWFIVRVHASISDSSSVNIWFKSPYTRIIPLPSSDNGLINETSAMFFTFYFMF